MGSLFQFENGEREGSGNRGPRTGRQQHGRRACRPPVPPSAGCTRTLRAHAQKVPTATLKTRFYKEPASTPLCLSSKTEHS